MVDNPSPDDEATPHRPPPRLPEMADCVFRAEDLFRDRQEVWIELNGERYRLRITRRGKLILQK